MNFLFQLVSDNLIVRHINAEYKIKLKAGSYIKINNEGYMSLTIECIKEQINTPWGFAKLYSVSHTYIQNSDLMRDPEMVFIVCDNRAHEKDFDNILIYTQIFQ